MITFKINGEGDDITYEERSLTFAEGMEVEQQTGLGVGKYLSTLNDGTTTSTAVLFWIGAVKHAAAQDGLSFRDAARVLTFKAFTDDVDLVATYSGLTRPDTAAPSDPTQPAPDGSTAPTSPVTSEPLPPETPSPAPGTPISDSSPTTSAFVPGSGTS
jgi:hypothetical protein